MFGKEQKQGETRRGSEVEVGDSSGPIQKGTFFVVVLYYAKEGKIDIFSDFAW